jgi:hypothetical protein
MNMPTPKKGYGHPQQALHQYKQKNEDLMHLYVIKLLACPVNYLYNKRLTCCKNLQIDCIGQHLVINTA